MSSELVVHPGLVLIARRAGRCRGCADAARGAVVLLLPLVALALLWLLPDGAVWQVPLARLHARRRSTATGCRGCSPRSSC